jgi:hypothetical protein
MKPALIVVLYFVGLLIIVGLIVAGLTAVLTTSEAAGRPLATQLCAKSSASAAPRSPSAR